MTGEIRVAGDFDRRDQLPGVWHHSPHSSVLLDNKLQGARGAEDHEKY